MANTANTACGFRKFQTVNVRLPGVDFTGTVVDSTSTRQRSATVSMGAAFAFRSSVGMPPAPLV